MNRIQTIDDRPLTIVKKITMMVVLLWSMVNSHWSFSQDIHFSQFNFSPLNQNPANTNLFNGDYRFVGNYKNQWSSVPAKFNTFSVSAEANFVTLKNNDRIGAGILFYYDRAGDSRFTSLHTALSLSYIKSLGKEFRHAVSGGVQFGLLNRSFDYSQLYFDNQWNGDVFDPNAPANENFSRTGFNVPDLGAGVAYRYQKDERTNVIVGLGVAHINRPRQSFIGGNPILMHPRYTAHVRGHVKLSKRLDIVPEFMYQRQQTKQEFVLGAYAKYYLRTKGRHTVALNMGAYGRIIDAGWLLAGVDFDNLQLNLSYDVNFSKLAVASRYNGGFEASIIYVLARVKKINKPVCPTFL